MDTDDFKATRKGAERLVGLAKLFAIGSYEPMVKMHPPLASVGTTKDWDYFCTIAIIGSTMMHLQINSDILTDSFQLMIGEELNSKLPRGWDAVEDLMKFIGRGEIPKFGEAQSTESKLHVINEQLVGGVGGWILWNLQKKAPEETDIETVSHFGRLFYEKFGAELAAMFLQRQTD